MNSISNVLANIFHGFLEIIELTANCLFSSILINLSEEGTVPASVPISFSVGISPVSQCLCRTLSQNFVFAQLQYSSGYFPQQRDY